MGGSSEEVAMGGSGRDDSRGLGMDVFSSGLSNHDGLARHREKVKKKKTRKSAPVWLGKSARCAREREGERIRSVFAEHKAVSRSVLSPP